MMFIEKETETRFFAFNPALTGPFSVYVDGSFNCEYDPSVDTMPMAAGWSIVDSREELFGYGGAHFTVPVTLMTSLCELRAIVSFLDAFREEFPGRINKEFPVTVISDNQHLVMHLNGSRTCSREDAYCREKYGQDYLRLLDYLSVMDLRFEWVKGHHVNNFNVLADRIARKAYTRVLKKGSYSSFERKEDCTSLLGLFHQKHGVFSVRKNPLTQQKLRNLVQKSGVEVLTSLPTLWIGAKTVQHKGRTFSGFAFTDSTFGVQGYRAGIHVKDPDELYVNLRALNYALGKYREEKELPESLVVRTDSEKLSALVNNTKHRKWKDFKANTAFQQEFEKLVIFKKDCSIVALEVSDGRRTYVKFPDMVKGSAFVEETSAKVAQAALGV